MKIAEIFQDHMVIQREKPCKIWGTASPDEEIKIVFGGKTVSGHADESGNWEIMLPPLPTAENITMNISGENSDICLKDIAVGEVWIAGGQSNMEFYMRYEKHMEEEKKICENPKIRIFDVPEVSYNGQEKDFDYQQMGIWRKADKKNLEYFSAAAYYFAKEIENKLQVPIGIIGCNWGGTSASVWMSPESAEKYAQPWVKSCKDRFAGMDMDKYWKMQKNSFLNDRGRPFEDAFSELVLPETVPQKQIDIFFAKMDPKDAEKLQMPQPQIIPGCLYEHMVKIIAPYSVRGVLWYQGESDDELENCQEYYGQMLTAVIKDWRNLWKDPELPFLIVQLPGWENWIWSKAKHFEIIRKCQQEVTDSDSHAWLCSISDAGEQHDIHPKDKKIVGQRLSLLALGHIYGEQILCDPPKAEEIKRTENKICIRFRNADGGLMVRGKRISALSVTSEGRELSFTEEIKGEYVYLHLPMEFEKNTVKISFAQTQWFQVNLYNKAGIPAIPFSFECAAS